MISPPTFEKSVREIALLFAVPVNRAEFVSRVSESDWLRKFDNPDADTAERQEHLESVWEYRYRPLVADPFCELMEAAARLGAEVRTQATLSTLRQVTAERTVVVVFAHWKGSEIINDDWAASIEEHAFVERVRDSNTPLACWLRDRFRGIGLEESTPTAPVRRRRFWPFAFASRPTPTLRGILRESLHIQLPEHSSVVDGVDQVLEHEVTRAARRRDTLDILFRGLLRPGNRLELFDGMHVKEAVEAAIAPNFEGVLDLTTCTSTVLADFIAARRHLRLRTVQFPTEQEPLWAAQCVKSTIELVAVAGLSYLEARHHASRELKQALYKIKQSQ